jgi:periplasmic mercuric ion binding protein
MLSLLNSKIEMGSRLHIKLLTTLRMKIIIMKTKILMLAILMMMGAGSLLAQDKTEKFEVRGNCGMCEKRIESAALSVDGVSRADWDQKTKMLELVLDESKTDANKVQKAIAKSGHDTKMHKASDETYDKLPGCCKYDRSEVQQEKNGHEGHNH